MKSNQIFFLLFGAILLACSPSQPKTEETKNNEQTAITDINEPAIGFNIEESDPTAIFLADKVMTAMGGRKAWNEIAYIRWEIPNQRTLSWDKKNNKVRIDTPAQNDIYLLNLNDGSGKVKKNGKVIESSDSLAKYLSKGHEIWFKDSYDLLMPYMLKENGVTLYYLGEDTTANGRDSQKLQLTFDKQLSSSPPMYEIWIDAEDGRITQTDYYPSEAYTEPTTTNTWSNYKKHGNILLPESQSNTPTQEIEVLTSLPKNTFYEF
ncbi:DUF6503 family protein [Reichenbachiella sp. MSK19-1]|uniref:DUF6503 family protein n=1 Tax=Reichenbachiella sp. MSK19-1 TaxID=1897631 RepID=UPI000E6BDACE|nr:DUF6503 family protein [Reichenbachiella sp. MSK19-1]RJE70505.1 hypothetical protein BGP76_10480 [Reichenbachiella sp. MSK19-1]